MGAKFDLGAYGFSSENIDRVLKSDDVTEQQAEKDVLASGFDRMDMVMKSEMDTKPVMAGVSGYDNDYVLPKVPEVSPTQGELRQPDKETDIMNPSGAKLVSDPVLDTGAVVNMKVIADKETDITNPSGSKLVSDPVLDTGAVVNMKVITAEQFKLQDVVLKGSMDELMFPENSARADSNRAIAAELDEVMRNADKTAGQFDMSMGLD